MFKQIYLAEILTLEFAAVLLLRCSALTGFISSTILLAALTRFSCFGTSNESCQLPILESIERPFPSEPHP